MNLLCGLVGVAAVLFVVVAVVHLIVTLARTASVGATTSRAGDCPSCAHPIGTAAAFCGNCGYRLGAARRPTLDDELEATTRQLQRLASSGRISDSTLKDVLDAIRSESTARTEERAHEPAAPADVASVPPASAASAETAAPSFDEIEFAQPVETADSAEIAEPVASSPHEVLQAAEPRGLASVLHAFMEEKNIRWGELISGLLIVGSSVGLVISLWATLKETVPYFPVAVFLAATAAMHGAGLYTLRRWRLKATSRGLLLVSTLLVPLNVLAAIALNDRKPVYAPIDYVAVTLGLGVLAAIVFSAARVLNKRNPWPMFVAVTGAAVGMSLIGRLTVPSGPEWRTLLLFAIPFGSFLFGAVAHVRHLAAGRRLSTVRAAQSFRFLGLALFSLVIAAALLAWKSGNVLGTLSLLSPLVSLLGAMITAAGLVIQRRMTAMKDAAYRTAGTAIALGGGLLVTAAVVLAWPRPDLLIEVGLLNAAAFSALGGLAAMPALHLFATTSLSLASLVGFQWAFGRISVATATSERLAELLLEARSALILTLLSLAADAAALVLARTHARLHAAGYSASAILHAGIAVAIAAYAVAKGLPDQNLATAVFALLALRWLAGAWWIRRAYATWIGAALLLAALGHGLGMNSAVAALLDSHGLRPVDPWTMAFLVHAAICTTYAAGIAWRATQSRGHGTQDALVLPLCGAAVVVSALAVFPILNVSSGGFSAHAGYALGIAAIWFIVALIQDVPLLVGAAQAIGTVGVVYGVIGHCRSQGWWSGNFIEPLHLNWQLSALAAWSGLWIAARRAVRPFPVITRVLRSGPVAVDRIVLGAVVAGFAVTCSLAAAPGIFAQEVLVGSIRPNPLPLHLLVVAPFAIGTILTAARAFFRERWTQAATAFGLWLVIVVVVARLAVVPTEVLWPGFPSPYGQGWGAGAWAALALIALVLTAAHWERPTFATFGGIASTLAALPFLVACRWDSELATASALSWTSAVTALAVAILWGVRKPAAGFGERLGWIASDSAAWRGAADVRNALAASTSLSILAIVAGNMVSQVGQGFVTAGPVAGSFFASLGPAARDAVPLALVAASFVVYAVAERNALWGMSATFLAQCAFGLVASYSIALAERPAGHADFVRFLQQMGIAAGVGAVCWLVVEQLAARRGQVPAAEGRPLRTAMLTQVLLTGVFASLLAAEATYGVWVSPEPLLNSVKTCGSPLGWSLLILAAGLWCAVRRHGWPRSAVVPAVTFFAAAAPLAAASLADWNGPANWLSFHTAIAGWCGLIAVTVGGAVIAGREGKAPVEPFVTADSMRTAQQELRPPASEVRPIPAARGSRAFAVADWTLSLTVIVVLFALRGLWDDPLRPWWSAGAALWISLCTLILAAVAASRRRSYLSLAFAVLGSVFIGLKPWLLPGAQPNGRDAFDLVDITLIGAALHALAWTAIEVFHARRRPVLERPAKFPPPQQVVALLGTIVAGLRASADLVDLLFQVTVPPGAPIVPVNMLGWSALALLAVLCVASLWERGARHGLPLLYALGLVAVATWLGGLNRSQHELVIAAVCSLSAYVVLTGAAWAFRGSLGAVFSRLGVQATAGAGERVHRWLWGANLVAGLFVIATGFWIVLAFPEPGLRIAAALATLALGLGFALLAAGPRQRAIEIDALAVGAIAAAQTGWALMDAGPVPHEELRRTIRLMVTLAATAFVYGVPLVRLVRAGSSWFLSIRRVAVGVAAAAVVSLGLILVFETLAFDPSAGSAVTVTESVVVAVALAGLAAGLISLAVLPGRDPFLSTEKQRFLYVYGGEAVAGLLFAHLYLTNPQLFRHLLRPYWPLVVMGIAFCGAGISELFGRLKVNVLAKPVEHTAAFLPVLPLLGFWLFASDLRYSTTLVAVGVLYLFLSLRRGSFVYAAAAAIVGNATLCALFAEHGVSLFLHPQMFIIPPCVTVLAAAQMNRERLGETALASLRYFAITTIYVSSTGEMFQHGIGTTLWLPMVLAGLSVLGVLAGIMVRVRAFLYLGTSFLLLSLVSMVWHASRSIGHVWPWWVFLFTLGLALLTLFGIFEKKRQEMLALIERLRQWER